MATDTTAMLTIAVMTIARAVTIPAFRGEREVDVATSGHDAADAEALGDRGGASGGMSQVSDIRPIVQSESAHPPFRGRALRLASLAP